MMYLASVHVALPVTRLICRSYIEQRKTGQL